MVVFKKIIAIVYLLTYLTMFILKLFFKDDNMRIYFNNQFHNVLKLNIDYHGFYVIYMFFNPLFASLSFWLSKKYGIYIIIFINILLLILQFKYYVKNI